MEFIITEVDEKDLALTGTITHLREILNDEEGFCFIRYPLFNLDSNIELPSLIILSRYFGLLILDVFDFDMSNLESIEGSKWRFKKWDWTIRELFEEGEDKLFSIAGKVNTNRDLRKFTENDLRLKGKYFIHLPDISRSEWASRFGRLFEDKVFLKEELSRIFDYEKQLYTSPLPDKVWTQITGLFSGAPVLMRPTRRIEGENTKAGIIRKVESQIQTLDLEQMKIAQQIPPGPQRIRGLAGTGKTIVLAMKAAYAHLQHPEWNIVYTFNTQSLYDYI
ncbi:MAG TPA: hypothetical protein VKC34_17660 [Blastocatellia bacterium]|nr:hypothetical protein [Blastocatellia bacterium]